METVNTQFSAPSTGPKANIDFEAPDLVRKHGCWWRLQREVEAMSYVRQHTTLPVPIIIQAPAPPEPENETAMTSFLMQRLPDIELGTAWPSMTPTARSETLRQLKTHFAQLHPLRPPVGANAGAVQSCSGGPVYDHRLDNLATCGPFRTVAEFHDFLVAPVRKAPKPGWADKYRVRLRDDCGVRFAHGDVSWENILVEPETGEVTGILDWEMAGFWPAWWEYRKGLFGGRSQLWWMGVMGEVMGEWREEAEVDMDLEMY